MIAGLTLIAAGIVFCGVVLNLDTGPHRCGHNLICNPDITENHRRNLLIAGGLAIWLGATVATATYGWRHGFSFIALFISALFFGCPIVIFLIALITGGRRQPAAVREAVTNAQPAG